MTCELPKVCSEREVTARKSHVCCECRKPIPPGVRYVRTSGIWDTARTFKTCVRCHRLRTAAIKKYPPMFVEEGPAFGELRDWLREGRG